MSIKIPRRELLDLINRIREKPLDKDQCASAFQTIEDAVTLYTSNLRHSKTPAPKREQRKRALTNFKKALDTSLLCGNKANFYFEGVAELDMFKNSAKTLLAALGAMLSKPTPKGKEADDRKWAIGALAKVFRETTGKRETSTYSELASGHTSNFLEFAKLCFSNMKPHPFPTESKLGRAIHDALSKRGRHKTE
jgi:hypothetical protein